MGINKAPKMSDEEIAAAKRMNIKNDNLEGVQLLPMPTGCEACHTPMAQCKGLEDPAEDGIHYFDGRWLCDSCLQHLGRVERGLEEPDDRD